MVKVFIFLLVFLWLTGVISIPAFSLLHRALFYINRQPFTIWDLLFLAVILYIAGILPAPFKGLATILLIFWLLNILGIIAISGLTSLILILLLVGLIFHLLGFHF